MAKRKTKSRKTKKRNARHKAARETLADYLDAPFNPREITADAQSGLSASIEVFGDLSGFVVNKRTGHIVCGHQRRKSTTKELRGAKIVWGHAYTVTLGNPDDRFESDERSGAVTDRDGRRFTVREVDWSEDFEKLANLTANNAAIQGRFTFDAEKLIDEQISTDPDAARRLLLDELVDASPMVKTERQSGRRRGDVDLSPELHERSDYILVVFDSQLDWQAACERLKIETATAIPNGGSERMRQQGLGRVISGRQLNAILAGRE